MMVNRMTHMAKRLKISKILRDNPQVDRNLLVESQSLVKALRSLGNMNRPIRRLTAPSERRRPVITRSTIKTT
jgi:hypothetical protein